MGNESCSGFRISIPTTLILRRKILRDTFHFLNRICHFSLLVGWVPHTVQERIGRRVYEFVDTLFNLTEWAQSRSFWVWPVKKYLSVTQLIAYLLILYGFDFILTRTVVAEEYYFYEFDPSGNLCVYTHEPISWSPLSRCCSLTT